MDGFIRRYRRGGEDFAGLVRGNGGCRPCAEGVPCRSGRTAEPGRSGLLVLGCLFFVDSAEQRSCAFATVWNWPRRTGSARRLSTGRRITGRANGPSLIWNLRRVKKRSLLHGWHARFPGGGLGGTGWFLMRMGMAIPCALSTSPGHWPGVLEPFVKRRSACGRGSAQLRFRHQWINWSCRMVSQPALPEPSCRMIRCCGGRRARASASVHSNMGLVPWWCRIRRHWRQSLSGAGETGRRAFGASAAEHGLRLCRHMWIGVWWASARRRAPPSSMATACGIIRKV